MFYWAEIEAWKMFADLSLSHVQKKKEAKVYYGIEWR